MLFENPADCFVLKSVVPDYQRHEMRDWLESLIADNILQPNSVGENRSYRNASEIERVPPFYHALKAHLAQALGVDNYDDDPELGDLVTCNADGAQIHKHRDAPDGPDRWHIRANLYLQAAEHGGEPILRGQQLDLEEGDCWAFIANATEHWNNPVTGSKRRLVFSYAMMVDQPNDMIAKFVLPKPRIRTLTGLAPLQRV